jgi:hypothetical protein
MAKSTSRPASTKTRTPAAAADPLDSLLNDATSIEPKKPGAKKKQRDLIELTDGEATAFDRFCMADAALKMAKGHQEGSKATILPVLTDKLLRMWCEEGRRTDNPRVQTEQGQAILQARENLRFDIPAGEDGEPGTVTDALMAVGFDEDKANEIREREFTETTELRFAAINKLREDPDSKKVVDKLLKLVLENFTPAERAKLLEKVNNVTLNEGFLDRAVQHADSDPSKLKSLLSVVRPTFLMSQIVWKGELTEAVKTLSKDDKPAPVVSADAIPATTAPAVPKIFTSDDGQWKATCAGNEAKLFMIQAGAEIEMATKVCTGGVSHAEQTCKKWMRDDNYRAESLKKK